MPGAGRDQSHKSLHDGTIITDPPAATAKWQTPTWVPQMVLSGLTAGELCAAGPRRTGRNGRDAVVRAGDDAGFPPAQL